MGARTKLNAVSINAALLIGAVLGSICESWSVFFVTTAAIVASEFYTGNIRPPNSRSKSLRR